MSVVGWVISPRVQGVRARCDTPTAVWQVMRTSRGLGRPRLSEVPGMLKGMGRSGKGPLSAISGVDLDDLLTPGFRSG